MENLGQILEDFLAASRGFCEAAEAVERLPLKDFLMGLEVAFSRAYSVGALLPELEPDSPDLEKQHHEEGSARLHAALHGLPSPDPRDAQRWQLFDAICGKLGDAMRSTLSAPYTSWCMSVSRSWSLLKKTTRTKASDRLSQSPR